MARQNVKRFLYMPTTNALLDKVKESCSLPSDNVLSHKLGVTRAVISGWRNDRYPIPDERIAQLCAMAKLDGGEWMARIHAERAASPAEKALWRSVLDRLSAAAAVVALLVLAVHTGAHEALLTALSPLALTAPSIHYAKSSQGRIEVARPSSLAVDHLAATVARSIR
ncbi:hypothetical protein E2P69_07700 [Xanthomonas perforans]|nr:hypothetical protein E2P66_21115 [Xanthomonas perforans]TVS55274.1 hypothetical protein E2P69_07700 [Xanthomonas perforans]TVS64378.1 hypothetical protein E2P70_12775 [Xanthomonas perforans]TVS65465.1 hypothetical protein E2P67_14505 [Xanthomonas perforans]